MAKYHFSHEHPLALVQQQEEETSSSSESSLSSILRCYGCTQKITEVPYYRCEEGCAFFHLHQACADMPTTINPDYHNAGCSGDLTLTKHLRPDLLSQCTRCARPWYRFAYVCTECEAVVDLQCAMLTYNETKQSFHQHPVGHLFTWSTNIPCSFCDRVISGEEDESCYGCSYCDFIAHIDCTPVPLRVVSPSHPDHELQLIQLFMSATCRICIQVIEKDKEWAYFCFECGYCTHVHDYNTTRIARDGQLEHFSHGHPLVLVPHGTTSDNLATEKQQHCHGCRRKISSGTPYYTCNFFCKSFHLHKLCAELPMEIKHHQLHPSCELKLITEEEVLCDACGENCSKGFAYQCDQCDFDLDIICTLRAHTIKKTFHKHPLMLSHTSPSFECHACDRDTQGSSYQCNSCQFWVHQQCASLPMVKDTSSHEHDHDLNLVYSIPEVFSEVDVYCQICTKNMKHHNWAYHCYRCRYFIHVYDCSNPHRDEFTVDTTATVIDLPLPDGATIEHHRHPMILFADQFDSNDIDLAPSLINLVRGSVTWPTFHIDGKGYSGHTFSFSNDKLVMQITSVDLPQYIKHEAHPHVLKSTFLNTLTRCNACEQSFFGCGFGCTACAFTIDTYCALLPRKIKHTYDKHHPFPLTYAAIEGIEEYVCEICEGDVIPKWFYHCEDCDQSIHARCIWNAYTEFERFYRFHLHKCSLTLVPPSEDLPKCIICLEQETFGHGLAFLCKACNFLVHLTCTSVEEVEISENEEELSEDECEISNLSGTEVEESQSDNEVTKDEAEVLLNDEELYST